MTKFGLQFCKPFFHWPDRPAFTLSQFFNRCPFVIEWTDVSQFNEFQIDRFIDPSERQSLCSTDIGPIRVNPAPSFLVEERTPTKWMW